MWAFLIEAQNEVKRFADDGLLAPAMGKTA